jgi:hypothetical protein
MVPTRKKTLQLDRNILRSLAAIKACIVLAAVLALSSLSAVAEVPTARPQIQGGNLRVEFDNRLRTRVIALFDNKEMVLGPFTASETVTTTGKLWTEFVLTSRVRSKSRSPSPYTTASPRWRFSMSSTPTPEPPR